MSAIHHKDDGLITQFWGEVRTRLIDHHRKLPGDADRGIQQYRSDADRLGFAGAVYNHGPDQTADAIAGWVDKDTWPGTPPG